MFRMVETPASPEPDAVLVHVGVHKTGSTWLQRSFFTPRGGGFLPVLDDGQVIDLIVRPHPLEWDPEPARDAIARGIAAARARGQSPDPLPAGSGALVALPAAPARPAAPAAPQPTPARPVAAVGGRRSIYALQARRVPGEPAADAPPAAP